MALFHRYRKAMLYVHRTATISPIQKLCFIAHYSSYSTSTSDSPSFTVNYLITNLQFSQEIASQVSKHVRLKKPERSDSVLALFRNYGFSNSQIAGIIRGGPLLLVADAHKTILPKLQFLESKGASRTEVLHIVTSNSRFLLRSLENCIIPSYDSLKRFLLSDERTIECIMHSAYLISENRITENVTLLLANGVPESKVAALLLRRPLSINSHPDFFKVTVEELKELGFNPSKVDFLIALHIKIIVSESAWRKRIDLYKRWGWSEDTTASAFLRRPWCMSISEGKIEEIMEFFVNHLRWDSMELSKHPKLLSFSLQKRIIPRASVIQFLQSKELISKNFRHVGAFLMSEKLFRNKFVNCYEGKAPELLKLYGQKKQNISNE